MKEKELLLALIEKLAACDAPTETVTNTAAPEIVTNSPTVIDKRLIGQYCLIRTYTDGVWAGTISEKVQDEIILSNARRLFAWRVKDNVGISLADVAVYGLDKQDTRICAAVESVWMQAIGIIPVVDTNIKEYIQNHRVTTGADD